MHSEQEKVELFVVNSDFPIIIFNHPDQNNAESVIEIDGNENKSKCNRKWTPIAVCMTLIAFILSIYLLIYLLNKENVGYLRCGVIDSPNNEIHICNSTECS